MKKYLSKVIMTFLIYLIGSLLFEQYNSFLIAYLSGVLTMGMSFIIEILQQKRDNLNYEYFAKVFDRK